MKLQSLQETFEEYEKRNRDEAMNPRKLHSSYLNMSPNKFQARNLALEVKRLDLDLERQVREQMEAAKRR